MAKITRFVFTFLPLRLRHPDVSTIGKSVQFAISGGVSNNRIASMHVFPCTHLIRVAILAQSAGSPPSLSPVLDLDNGKN